MPATVHIPAALLNSVDRRAKALGVNRNAAITAHALALVATLVTANLDHMPRVPGLRMEDWSD